MLYSTLTTSERIGRAVGSARITLTPGRGKPLPDSLYSLYHRRGGEWRRFTNAAMPLRDAVQTWQSAILATPDPNRWSIRQVRPSTPSGGFMSPQ